MMLLPNNRKRKLERNDKRCQKVMMPCAREMRKLIKLREEKESDIKLAASVEALEKNKIPESARALLQSSKKIGKVETRKIKRCKGFTTQHVDYSTSSSESEPESEIIKSTQLQRSIVEKQVENNIEESPKSSSGSTNRVSKLPAPSFLKDSKNKPMIFERDHEVDEARSNIPIIMMEQEIMEAINENSIVIIQGETGCGKTTQVPQFLYEAGIGRDGCPLGNGIIGVSQPRRIAVHATARRVAYELGVEVGKAVGYEVRFDKKISESTSIKFMTDGILLRELQDDRLLKRYSVIILDEVHERSLCTDVLIVMLSSVVALRQKEYEKHSQLGKSIDRNKLVFPLKLVLMSATMPEEDFVSYSERFGDPPREINVSSRQFKVVQKYSKKTVDDYMDKAYEKVLEIHNTMPRGGILVFVTGSLEVEQLCQKLRIASREMAMRKNRRSVKYEAVDSNCHEGKSEVHDDEFGSSFDTKTEINGDSLCRDTLEMDGEVAQVLKDINIASLKASFEALSGKSSDYTSACKESISCTLDGVNQSIKNNRNLGPKDGDKDDSLHVLPLYAALPKAAQSRVFEEVEEGKRLVVVATNVAETSITIPGIKYVVDTGKVKSKEYNYSNGTEKYVIQWISKASAIQRAGRAGRTGPGYCYRLYTVAAFGNVFVDCSPPEISTVPLDDLILRLKSMYIKLSAFPFLTRPTKKALDVGEKCLKVLGALCQDGTVTPLGKAMAYYPISPRHSKMLLTVIQILNNKHSDVRANLVLAYAVASVAALSLRNISVGVRRPSNVRFHSVRISDALFRANALRHYELSKTRLNICYENGLHPETMQEISNLRKQLLKLIYYYKGGVSEGDFSWKHGSMDDVEHDWTEANSLTLKKKEENLLCRAICAGWADRVAKRITGSTGHAVQWYKACMIKETVHLNLQSSGIEIAPEYLVYNELVETTELYMHGVTCVEPEWLVECSELLTFPNGTKCCYDRESDKIVYKGSPCYGDHSWKLPVPEQLHPRQSPDLKGAVAAFAFAFALLDGKVLGCLRPFRKLLAERHGCSTNLKFEAAGIRIGSLALKMEEKKIHSRAMLRELWEENPKELLPEIRNCFQKSFHKQFMNLWDEMLREAKE